jgi:hypothetical protein
VSDNLFFEAAVVGRDGIGGQFPLGTSTLLVNPIHFGVKLISHERLCGVELLTFGHHSIEYGEGISKQPPKVSPDETGPHGPLFSNAVNQFYHKKAASRFSQQGGKDRKRTLRVIRLRRAS